MKNKNQTLKIINSAKGIDDSIIVSKKSGDVFNPKVVRSTMGAIFRVNVIECENLEKTVKELKKHKYDICATCLEESKSLYDTEFTKTAVIIGNEGNGVSEQLLNIADKKIKIPMLGKTESLNASVATGIVFSLASADMMFLCVAFAFSPWIFR